MIRAISKVRPARIGPKDHGRRMSLDRFASAVAVEGYVYELSKGVIEVTDVPFPDHFEQVDEVRNQLLEHRFANPSAFYRTAGSNECKLLIGPSNSERHPDLSVYFKPPPRGKDVWSIWRPSIVIEVVSKSSVKRDYEEKPDEYLQLGIDEYWIIDSFRGAMTAHVRWRGMWRATVIKPPKKYVSSLLPRFSLDLKKVFAAARRARD